MIDKESLLRKIGIFLLQSTLMSTAATTSAIFPPLYVWIKLVTRELDNFAKIIIQPGSHVADVASLSCSTLEWGGLRANNVNIYLVIESSSDDPSTASITEALNRAPLRMSSMSSHVKSGSWLVAKPIQLSSVTSTVSTGECIFICSFFCTQ